MSLVKWHCSNNSERRIRVLKIQIEPIPFADNGTQISGIVPLRPFQFPTHIGVGEDDHSDSCPFWHSENLQISTEKHIYKGVKRNSSLCIHLESFKCHLVKWKQEEWVWNPDILGPHVLAAIFLYKFLDKHLLYISFHPKYLVFNFLIFRNAGNYFWPACDSCDTTFCCLKQKWFEPQNNSSCEPMQSLPSHTDCRKPDPIFQPRECICPVHKIEIKLGCYFSGLSWATDKEYLRAWRCFVDNKLYQHFLRNHIFCPLNKLGHRYIFIDFSTFGNFMIGMEDATYLAIKNVFGIHDEHIHMISERLWDLALGIFLVKL